LQPSANYYVRKTGAFSTLKQKQSPHVKSMNLAILIISLNHIFMGLGYSAFELTLLCTLFSSTQSLLLNRFLFTFKHLNTQDIQKG